jgi:hypothetical protein
VSYSADRLARRLLERTRALDVPEMPDPDAPVVPPLEFARMAGFDPDRWQADVLASTARKVALLCCRQSGKSTTSALLAAHEAVTVPGALALMLAPSLRQSGELFRKVVGLLKGIEEPMPKIVAESALRLELDNGSRIIALPGSEATTRGYSAATLVVIDEAARVPDSLIAAVRPSLATTEGRLVALSTPAGRRGWFYTTWADGEGWERTKVVAADCPRISESFLADERRELGEFVYLAEYECEFQDVESAAFASEMIEAAVTTDVEPLWGRAA